MHVWGGGSFQSTPTGVMRIQVFKLHILLISSSKFLELIDSCVNYSTAIFIELYRENLQIVLNYLPTPTKFLVSITEKMMYKILENQIDTMHTFSVISNFRVERLMAGTL